MNRDGVILIDDCDSRHVRLEKEYMAGWRKCMM